MVYHVFHAQLNLDKIVQHALLTNVYHVLMDSYQTDNVVLVLKELIQEVVNVLHVQANVVRVIIKLHVLHVQLIIICNKIIVLMYVL